MEEIQNIKKHFVLGISGTSVICYLLDSKEQIKVSNEDLTDQEADTVYSLLQAEIDEIKSQQEEKLYYYE